MAASKTEVVEQKERTILLIMDSGSTKRISGIPANAKITFGRMHPSDRGGYGSNTVRIYTSKENQLAAIVGVQQFYDLDLTIETKRLTKRTYSDEATKGPKGKENKSESKEEYEWVTDDDSYTVSRETGEVLPF